MRASTIASNTGRIRCSGEIVIETLFGGSASGGGAAEGAGRAGYGAYAGGGYA
jgi:hypothetical protein